MSRIEYYVKYNRPSDNKRCVTSNCKTKDEAEIIAAMFNKQGFLNVEIKEIRY
jgi:hypothetical protein